MVSRVASDSDDGERLVEPIGIVEHELAAQRIGAGKKVFDHGFIHHGNASRRRGVLRLDAAAGQNRDAHH